MSATTAYREIEALGVLSTARDALAILKRHGFTADSDAAPEYPAELVERAFALVREVGKPLSNIGGGYVALANSEHDEARAIVAELSKRADPLLIEAREIAAKFYDGAGWAGSAEVAAKIKDGLRDETAEVQMALAALRRGITIQQEAR